MPGARLLDTTLATYSYAVCNQVVAANSTDVIQLQGVNLKSVKVRYIQVGGSMAAGSPRTQMVQIVRRANPSTVGTPVVVPVPDSSDPPAAAPLLQFFATAATPGSPAFVIDQLTFGLVAAGAIQDRAVFNYEQFTEKGVTLNNSGEYLSIGLAQIPTTGNDRFGFSIWWTEQ